MNATIINPKRWTPIMHPPTFIPGILLILLGLYSLLPPWHGGLIGLLLLGGAGLTAYGGFLR
jgi:hypothetical protein